MPVEPCREGGKPGYRAGPSLKCYTYTAGSTASRGRARARAEAQHTAIYAEKQVEELDRLEGVFDDAFWEELRATMMRRLLPRFREAFVAGAMLGSNQRPTRRRAKSAFGRALQVWIALKQDVGEVLPFDFEAANAAADDVIGSYSDQWWGQFRQSTQEGLRRSISRARANGLGVDAVVSDIAPLFGEQRAHRIAVSEMTNLMGQGAQATYRQAGFGEWEWRTVRDARVDPICENLDRQRFSMAIPFQRAHPNCRCFPVPAGDPSVNPLPAPPAPVGLNFPGNFAA